jgi:hypothetical protein
VFKILIQNILLNNHHAFKAKKNYEKTTWQQKTIITIYEINLFYIISFIFLLNQLVFAAKFNNVQYEFSATNAGSC